MNSAFDLDSWLSTWGVIKAAGFTSYLLVLASVILGAFSYGATLPPKVRGILLPMHQFAGWLGFLFGLLHGLTLVVDNYQPFSLKSIFVPFTAEYRPLASGLGSIALYIFAAILISSDMMKRLGKKVWRQVHLLSYPMFFLSLIHGITAGSDSGKEWATFVYASGAVLFAGALVMRGYIEWKAGRKSLVMKSSAVIINDKSISGRE